MSTKDVLLFICDGFSDWEPSYATVGISMTGTYQLKTVGPTKESVTSMGRLTVTPDLEINEVDISQTAMLILPGGTSWEDAEITHPARELVERCLANDIPVAAICAATEFLAREGWLDEIDHTSNHPEFLKMAAPGYRGAERYRVEPAVTAGNIITASGISPLSFAREIFERLDLTKDKELREWFQWFERFNTETVGVG